MNGEIRTYTNSWNKCITEQKRRGKKSSPSELNIKFSGRNFSD